MDKGKHVPLQTLSVEALTMLSMMLNPVKIIPTETNLPRDWRGVAELARIPFETIRLFESKPDPFKELMVYLSKPEYRDICLADLKAYLGVIDRFDVLEDGCPIFERDEEAYLAKISNVQLNKTVETLDAKEEANIITFEDTLRAQQGLPLCRYDAFILYSEDDAQFAEEVVRRLELEYDLKICSKDRDLLPGLKFEHEVIGKMIETRCNRLLVIFSPRFLESNANQFLVSYAQAIALDSHSRKIIPCIYQKCELPPSVRFSFCIDYNRSGKLWNFWDKLSQSLLVARNADEPRAKLANNEEPEGRTLTQGKDFKEDNLDWWDASKSSKLAKKDLLAPSDNDSNGLSYKQFDDMSDTMSINSHAKLVPDQRGEQKPSKWFSKIINRKKRSKQDKYKEEPLME